MQGGSDRAADAREIFVALHSPQFWRESAADRASGPRLGGRRTSGAPEGIDGSSARRKNAISRQPLSRRGRSPEAGEASRTTACQTTARYRGRPRGPGIWSRPQLLPSGELVPQSFDCSKVAEVDRALLAGTEECGTHTSPASR